MQALADELAAHLCPRTRAYHEIWLTDPDTGEETLAGGGSNGHEVEPIYGPTYLPRKFKTAIGLPGDNCVDLYANDLGLMAIVENDTIVGYNVLVGGGMGVTPSAEKTFPAVAKRMASSRPTEAIDVATAIVKVQRDFGNRADRKVARLKYLIHNWGLPTVQSQGRRVLRPAAGRSASRRRARLRRPHRLARARRRPLVLRPERRERPHPRRRRLAAEDRPPRDLPHAQARASG